MIKGTDISVMLDGRNIAHSRECSLTTECELIETSSSSASEWREFIPARISWGISCSRLLVALSLLETQTLVGRTVSLKFFCDGIYLYGNAIVKSVKAVAPVGKLSAGEIAFQGTGALSNEEGVVYFRTSDGEFFLVRH